VTSLLSDGSFCAKMPFIVYRIPMVEAQRGYAGERVNHSSKDI
jgi:hypothetical protein